MTDTLIIDQSGDRKYYSQIPHLIDDLGLSVYGFRLYCHLKRVTGEDGQSWQSTKTLATCCNMSIGSVVLAKQELVDNRLIKITETKSKHGGRDYHLITIVDIWKRNINLFSKEQVHVVNLQDTTVNLQVHVVERKNNPIKNATQPKKENIAASSADPIPSDNSNELSSVPGKSADFTLQDENILILKNVTGHYPPKKLRPTLVKIFNQKLPGVLLDESILKDTFTNWIARGYNPMNYTGILQRYFERDYYVPDQDRITVMAEEETQC